MAALLGRPYPRFIFHFNPNVHVCRLEKKRLVWNVWKAKKKTVIRFWTLHIIIFSVNHNHVALVFNEDGQKYVRKQRDK